MPVTLDVVQRRVTFCNRATGLWSLEDNAQRDLRVRQERLKEKKKKRRSRLNSPETGTKSDFQPVF